MQRTGAEHSTGTRVGHVSDTPHDVSNFLLLIFTLDTSRTRRGHACPILDTLGTQQGCNCENKKVGVRFVIMKS